MTSRREITRDYRNAGALHSVVGMKSAVGRNTFATGSGELIMFVEFHGKDGECLDATTQDQLNRRFEPALRLFNGNFRLAQYQLKREADPFPQTHHDNAIVEEATRNRLDAFRSRKRSLFAFETVFAVSYSGEKLNSPHRTSRRKRSVFDRLSARKTIEDLAERLERACRTLEQKVEMFATQLKDVGRADVLTHERGYAFLRRLLNYEKAKADAGRLKHRSFVDFQACDSELECHADFLRLDDYLIKVLTLKELPAQTFANVLAELTELPAQYIIHSDWQSEEAANVRRVLKSKSRHFFNLKTSLATHLSAAPTSNDHLVDHGAEAVVDDLGACLQEIETHGRIFGQYSLTVILYDKDPNVVQQAVAECLRVFGTRGAQLTEERYNRLNAWLAVLPGNTAYNLRQLWLSDTNCADLAFLNSIDSGEPRNEHLRAECLTVLEGAGGVPYFFNLHVKDVAHTLVLGATGSGKSFLLNFLITHFQKYDPLTFILDVGGSYRSVTRLFDGSYLSFGNDERPLRINPFSLPPTDENLAFLLAFVRVLIECGGYQMTGDDEKDLYEQINSLYQIAPDQRRLFTLSNIVRRSLSVPLQRWVERGPYAAWFDNAEDTLTLARFQTFDFEGMDRAAGYLEPLLFYILHRANARIYDLDEATRLKILVADEAWRFFRHPSIKGYLVEALKTWRRKNAAIILATQSGDDLIQSALLPIVAESCPTKIFLSNPDMDRKGYESAFHLNETESELIARLKPKKQMLLKRPDGSKRLDLVVDPKGYWLYTNNPYDNQRRREVFAQHGFKDGLEVLSGGRHED